jgi:hypothetical protein
MTLPERDPELTALLDPTRPLTDAEREAVAREGDAPLADDLHLKLAALREDGAPSRAFTERAMRAIAVQQGGAWRRLRNAALRPRTLRFNLATAVPLLAAAAMVIAVAASRQDAPPNRALAVAPAAPPARPELRVGLPVTFSLAAPLAARVAVVGDFNGWDVNDALLEDRDGDGVWTATLVLAPGRYAYQFVIDGERWRLDPNAEAVQPDDFGGENSVLTL